MPRLPGESGCAARIARPEFGLFAWARDAFRAVGLHQRPPVGLLIVGDPDHVDLDFEAEQRAGEGERRAPLPGAGLGRKLGYALFLIVEGLGDRGVGLVAPGGADALVFVEDARGRSERLLEPPRAIERRRTPQAIDVADGRREFRCAARRSPPGRSAPSERAARDRRARPACRCRDAAPGAAATADRRRYCTRRGESDPRPGCSWSARSCSLPAGRGHGLASFSLLDALTLNRFTGSIFQVLARCFGAPLKDIPPSHPRRCAGSR